MSQAEAVAKALDPEKAKKVGREWVARCPAHNDNNPSLFFKDAPGRENPVFICRAGCEGKDVIRELKERDLWINSFDSGEVHAWQLEQEKAEADYKRLLDGIKAGNGEAATLAYLKDEPIEQASPIVSVAEFNSIEFPPDKPIIGPISKGTINLFGGLSGVGKTLFAHDLAAGASAGGSVAHWRCLTPAKTVVIDGEMGGYKMQQRMAAVSRPKHYDLITSAMMLLAGDERLNLFHQLFQFFQ